MKKSLIVIIIFFSLTGCFNIPNKEEPIIPEKEIIPPKNGIELTTGLRYVYLLGAGLYETEKPIRNLPGNRIKFTCTDGRVIEFNGNYLLTNSPLNQN